MPCKHWKTSCLAAAIALLLCWTLAAVADSDHPLRPPDTSSPRATLQGFIATTDEVYRRMATVLDSYGRSDRLFPSPEERREHADAFKSAVRLSQYFDESAIAPVLRDTLVAERIVQLKEILDRIDIPAITDIPDRAAVAHAGLKRWRLPDTAIELVMIENGPRAGDFVVSADTVDRLAEFYHQVKNLPYRPGPAAELASVYREFSPDTTYTIYDAVVSSPVGLSYIVPPRWLLQLPAWSRARFADAATWQWFGLSIGLLIGGLIIYGAHRVARRPDGDDAPTPGWAIVIVPLAVVLVAGLWVPLISDVLRISGWARIVILYSRTVALYLGLAWLMIASSVVIGEAIVASDRLTIRSLDNQLIRLGARLVGLIGAIALLIHGGDELGLPAYSVLAGLGVGGVAVALAAQSTIANLIGSLLISIEKPFRIGHAVRIGSIEGTVEDVGFRSTRIRAADNTLVTIPSSNVVNSTVENLTLRPKRRQRFFVQVTYDTPREKLEAVVAGIRQLIVDHTTAEAGTCQVRFNSFAESSLDILVIFNLQVEDYTSELRERESVLLKIMDLLNDAGVEFAFPTRTIQIDNAAQLAQAPPVRERYMREFAGRS
ncbi:MAG TPA: mechanosensitive ion channel family protein [Acetobacteraceae bacterium]|nr:mechanosensitive ion channel family protein [Acetobacteraceae bacterium]